MSTVQESRFWWWQVPGINRQDQEGKVEEEEQVQQVLHRPEVKQGAVLRCLKKKVCSDPDHFAGYERFSSDPEPDSIFCWVWYDSFIILYEDFLCESKLDT